MKDLRRDLSVAVIGALVIPVVFLIYFAYYGATGSLITVFINVGLASHLTWQNVPLGITLEVIAQSLPLWTFAVLGFAERAYVLFKRKLTSEGCRFSLLLIGWLIFGVAVAFFPPYFGHRYIYLIGPASILAGVGVTAVLKNLRISWKTRLSSRFVFSSFAITLLIVSIPIAFAAQSEQYPHYDINSRIFDLHWSYADETSYVGQTRLGAFLRSNCSSEASILVYGWSPEIYYLADKLPLGKYVWSAPLPGVVEVPSDEYNRFVEGVKHHEFEFVVIFDIPPADYNVENLEFRRNDAVINQTLNNYLYVGNIDNALIFTLH